jgi:hypothetical protein
MNRWRVLGLAVVAIALGLVVLGRLPHAPREVATATAAPLDSLTYIVRDGGVEPPAALVAKDHRVRLTVVNASSHAVTPRIPGYDDRLVIPALAAGETWSGEFTADRPGADFALWIGDEPAARLTVAGSHLVEGHR